ncbi:hypothetical protein L195_g028893 [Trifolium pratense]|uniref:Uncharacterized protein n=1 Tax=Trifolium pratense TaxID=57577 RepID=A0A2K3L385_TRIPR|nr:hypothetical protein L195_g028893 [Trifolium pratense]
MEKVRNRNSGAPMVKVPLKGLKGEAEGSYKQIMIFLSSGVKKQVLKGFRSKDEQEALAHQKTLKQEAIRGKLKSEAFDHQRKEVIRSWSAHVELISINHARNFRER